MEEKSYHHGNLHEALIEAGLEILAEEGAKALSLRKAARKAGVSHAAPYRHFKDKEDLIAAIGEEGFHRLVHYLNKAVDQNPEDPLAQFLESGLAYVQFGLENPDHLKVMFTTPSYNRPLNDGNAFGILVEIIERCQAADILVVGDPIPIAMAAWSQVHGVAMLLIGHRVPPVVQGQITAEEVARFCIQTLVDGLKK